MSEVLTADIHRYPDLNIFVLVLREIITIFRKNSGLQQKQNKMKQANKKQMNFIV